MKVTKLDLEGLLLIKPKVFGDSRGYFYESWNQKAFSELGLNLNFVQDNISYSKKGVLRGLHFQNPHGQGKLIQVLLGEVYDVAVDVRLGSSTFGKYQSLILSSENKSMFYIPPGFAHGFCVLSEEVVFNYKCTEFYRPASEQSILWNDSDLNIPWPIENPTISDRDREGVKWAEFEHDKFPSYLESSL